MFWYLVDAIQTRGGSSDSLITKSKSGWSKFKDFVSLLTGRELPFGAMKK